MKNFRFLFLFAISLLILTSCNKDKDIVLGTPTLISPLNNESITYDYANMLAFVEFDWSDVASASGYELEISTTSDFSILEYTEYLSSSDAELHHTYFNDVTTYYWRVKATGINEFKESEYSEVFMFSF